MRGDILFVLQVAGALIFGGSQCLRMIESTQGISLMMFVCAIAFMLINLSLAIAAHRTKPSRVTSQTIASYGLWLVMLAIDLGAIARHGYAWSQNDTTTVLAAATGILAAATCVVWRKVPVSDPFVRASVAICLKALPQVLMAGKIFLSGGGGLSLVAIVAAHITMLTRLGQLRLSIKEAGWDRNRVASAISEVANEMSWVAVTVAWVLC